jgi:hypothetical protein
MAVISTVASGGTGIYLIKANPAGSPVNTRASHTIMGRVKFTAVTSADRYDCLGYLNNSDFSGTFFGKAAGSTTVCRGGRQNSSATFQGRSPAATADTTTWRHFAVVYDATAALITYYVDGVSVGTQASVTTYVTSASGATLTIYACISKAKQADMAVFNRALSAGEVGDMCDYRVPQVTSGLVGFWRFDTNANDSSGNGNDFTTAGSAPALSYSTADNPPQPENPVVNGDVTLTSGSTFVLTPTAIDNGAMTLTSGSTLVLTPTAIDNGAMTLTSGSTVVAGANTTKTAATTLLSSTTIAADANTLKQLATTLLSGTTVIAGANTLKPAATTLLSGTTIAAGGSARIDGATTLTTATTIASLGTTVLLAASTLTTATTLVLGGTVGTFGSMTLLSGSRGRRSLQAPTP